MSILENGLLGIVLAQEDYDRLKKSAELLGLSVFDGVSFAIALLEQASLDPEGRQLVRKSQQAKLMQ